MSKLNTIFEALQNKIDAGEISLESANNVLNKAKAKYGDEEVGELTEAAPLTLSEALDGINAILNEAEEACCGSERVATTSKDAPDLPEKTSTGEQVTNAIDANDNSSEKKMENLTKNNEANAKADAQGEEDKDTTINADDVTESVNAMRLRVYEAAEAGVISEDQKNLFLEHLDLDNYVLLNEKDDDEECDHEDKDGDGECDKCGADMDEEEDEDKKDKKKKKKSKDDEDDEDEEDEDEETEESALIRDINNLKLRVYESAAAGEITAEEKELFLDYLNLDNYVKEDEAITDAATEKILDAYTEGVLTEDQVIDLLNR